MNSCQAVSLLSDVPVGTLKSEPFQMLSGVPQVSHLGPRLFNLYTNDMSTAIKKKLSSLCLWKNILLGLSQSGLKWNFKMPWTIIVRWCNVNALELNVSKCITFTYSCGECCISCVYNISGTNLKALGRIIDLGLIMTPSLSPFEHIVHETANFNLVYIVCFPFTYSKLLSRYPSCYIEPIQLQC